MWQNAQTPLVQFLADLLYSGVWATARIQRRKVLESCLVNEADFIIRLLYKHFY